MDKKRLLIIDSFALVFRAYYAFPPNLTTSSGEVVNAVYGFTSLLMDVLIKFKPDHVIAVFDSGGPTLRHTEFSQYKANREAADDSFVKQIPRVWEAVEAFGIPIIKQDGIEADDLIGTLDGMLSEESGEVIIVTGDKDLFQLVDNNTSVYLAAGKFSDAKLYNPLMVKEKMGVTPEQIPDYKGLSGDPSDNIPGVKGVGPKTTVDLLTQYQTLEGIYEHIEEVKGKTKEKLVGDYEMAVLSKKLATIHRDIPLSFKIDDCDFKSFNYKKAKEFLSLLEFRTQINKLDSLSKLYEPKDLDLFSEPTVNEMSRTEFKEWDGENLGPKLYMLPEIANSHKSPIHWEINRLFVPANENIVVSADKVKEFFAVHKDSRLITFDKKKIWHAVINQKIDLNILEVEDIGPALYLGAYGQASFSLKSLANAWKVGFGETIEEHALLLPLLGKEVEAYLDKNKNLDRLISLEKTILSTIIKMEQLGIGIDNSLLSEYTTKLEALLTILKKDIYASAGHEFNINSPKQVGEILFVEKTLPVYRKTKTGSFSTDEESLYKLRELDPIIDQLLKFRELDKLNSTYIKALPVFVDNDKKIRATFDQFGAVSGRFSSKNPNMQNIPTEEPDGIKLRNLFISQEDSVLVSFDYSQQELRLLADFAKEDVMVDAFNTETDIHKLTAAELFEKDVAQVTDEERGIGKTVNFSIIYGISSYGLSERMKIERKVADDFIKKYFNKYKKVDGYLKSQVEKARQDGHLETVMGRRRVVPTILSNNKMLRSAAERELFNFVIQGSAADIMKICMGKFDTDLGKFPAKLLLQIHDEFVFEYKFESKTINHFDNPDFLDFIKQVKSIMNNAFELGVKFKVDAKVGKRWGTMEKIKNNV